VGDGHLTGGRVSPNARRHPFDRLSAGVLPGADLSARESEIEGAVRRIYAERLPDDQAP